MNREEIYQGLFDFVLAPLGDTIVTSSRQLRHWNDVPATEQPALFQAQVGEGIVRSGVPNVWRLSVDLYIYCSADGDAETIAATQINGLIDKVTQALAPPIKFGRTEQTLNDLVISSKISGKIETDAGLLGPQSVAIIPIEILVEE